MTTSIKEYTASLKITSISVDAAELASILGAKNAVLIQRGQPLSKQVGSNIASASVLRLESSLPRTRVLEDHVNDLLSWVESKAAEVKRLSAICDVEIWCFASFPESQLGFSFSHETLVRIGQHPISVVFDVYGGDG